MEGIVVKKDGDAHFIQRGIGVAAKWFTENFRWTNDFDKAAKFETKEAANQLIEALCL